MLSLMNNKVESVRFMKVTHKILLPIKNFKIKVTSGSFDLLIVRNLY